jgi:hypothetical protein
MPQLPEGPSWFDMSSDEILAQMYERFTFAQQFMNTLPRASFSYKPGNEQKVSIPRISKSVWDRQNFPVDLSHLESIPVTTGRSFDYYVIDDPIPEIDPNSWDSQLNGLTDLQCYYQNPRTWGGHLGDPTCLNNAKSAHLRCAVNPCGPCEGCKDYQPGVGGGGGAL